MPNIAAKSKKQIDSIIRQLQQGPSAGSTITTDADTGDSSSSSPADLARHKTSGDHDGRYYTETELSAVTDGSAGADLVGATPITMTGAANTVQSVLEAMANLFANYVRSFRQIFEATDEIAVAHGLGNRPVVQVIGSEILAYGAGLFGADEYGGIGQYELLAPDSIVHDSENQVTITLPSNMTGEVICIG